MSETQANESAATATAESENNANLMPPLTSTSSLSTTTITLDLPPPPPTTANASNSNVTTPASSITGGPTSKLKMPTNFGGSTGSVSKIGRLCTHATPKSGPPPRDTNSMSRESDDNLSSINSTYTDMYQETVKRFTRSSLSPEMERYSLSPSRSTKSTSTSYKSDAANDPRRTSFDLYLEATGRRRSSDHGAVLTADTEQFIIGQRVWVGGIRPGQIAYIGETHFAPGDWAGIVLDELNGKNDGCVAGKRYFQCEPKRGIFSRLTRLTMTQLPGTPQTPTSPLSKFSPDRSRTVSPTASIRSSFMRSPGKNGLTVGDRVIVSSGFGSRPGILRYLGETQFASGNWCGIELDDGTGKNDGSVDGIRYFECKAKFGVFVPIAKVSLSPSTKKTRLSRTGSRESLTSIGTMNSIATTNTSRMRMNAQRKPSSIKPIVASPKSQFSMQDLLREKQNHIEQLMIERDLDREDSQTSALQFQKNISELKSRITQLERQLEDERKKSEDLQFSIDEATFCGDELNAQTQVYKEKIHDLERKITNISSGSPSLQTTSEQDNSQVANVVAIESAHNAQLAKLSAKLQEQSKLYETRISSIQDEEKRLMENIKYLQTENDTLQKELLDKDESLEKFSLSESGIDNLRRELLLIKEENEKERQQTIADFMLKFDEKEARTKSLTEELGSMKNSLGTLESERSNVEDECEILRSECKSRNEQLQRLNEQIAKLSSELSMQKAESSTLDEMLKMQQLESAQKKTALEEKVAEVSKLKEEIDGLQNMKVSWESHIQTATEELKKQVELQKGFESKLQEAISADEEKQEAMIKLETVMEELKQQVNVASADNDKLNKVIKNLSETDSNNKAVEQKLHKELEEKEKLYVACADELKSTKELALKLQAEFVCLQQQSGQELSNKAKEIDELKTGICQLREMTATLKGESTASVQEMSGKITELEAQIKNLKEIIKKGEDAIAWQHQEQAQKESIMAEKVAELKTTAIELESANNLLGQLKKEHDNTLTKCRGLEELARKNDEKCAQQQLDLGDVTRKFEALNIKCENLVAQNEVLQQDILAARTTGSEAQAEMRKLNEEIGVKQKACVDLQRASNEERMKLESQIEELNQKLTNVSNNFDDLKEVLQKTKEDLAKKNDHATALEEKTIKQELSLSDAVRQHENLQIKIDSLAKQNESLQNDLTTLRTTSTDSNVELLKLSQDVAAKQKMYEELLDKTSAERAALEGQLQASQQRIDGLCLQVETLTLEVKNTTDESFQRFELLKQAQEKSGKQELDLGDLARKLESLTAKCESLESQNENLQKDLTSLRTTSTDSNAETVKLTEELSNKQKALQELSDKTSSERLQLESHLQEVKQQLEASQSEKESLCDELKSALDEQSVHTAELESFKSDLRSQSHNALEQVKAIEFAERKRLIENFETQMKNSDQTKIKLDEAISSLQNQIKLLQDELMKSQLDFKAKEEVLNNQIAAFNTEKEQLRVALLKMEMENTMKITHEQHEKSELLQTIQQLLAELKIKEEALQTITTEAEQVKTSQTTTNADLTKLETELKSLRNSLEISNTEIEHKTKLAAEDKNKIEELRGMLEALQTFNANISATNAELSEALQVLEHEKCETANIFELFEMESDQNAVQLIEKLTELKRQLIDTKTQVEQKDTALDESKKSVIDLSADLKASQSALAEMQANVLEQTTKLNELNQANEELKQAIVETSVEIKKREEIEQQLAEFKQAVDEMDDAATAKTSNMDHLQQRIQQLEQENISSLELQKTLKLEYTNLQRKMEMMDLDKTREMVALQGRINELQAIIKLNQNAGKGDGPLHFDEDSGNSTAQINFLNSIIADMQKKNDTLKAKIEALEALPADFTKPNAFALLAKRKPAPRVFCDICDEFDKHETEDCPLQASDDREYSPTFSGTEANNNDSDTKKERKLPEPRKYCESCEIFGHETGDCVDECF